MSDRRPAHSGRRLAALCFIAGFVDVIGFMSVLGTFVGHITSNITIAGAAFSHHNGRYALRLALLPIFIIAVALATAVNHWARVRRFNPERILLATEAVFLVVFMWSGAALQTYARNQPPELTIIAVASLAVFAMGVHNAATREARAMPTTTAMTANLTQFVMDVTDLCVAAPNRASLQVHARRGALVLGSFVAGAAIGTAAFLRWQFWSVSIPIAALLLLVITPPAYSAIPLPRRQHEL